MFGPVSGGHFNPVVSFVDASVGGITRRDARAYLPAQVSGCVLGAIAANAMFTKAAITISTPTFTPAEAADVLLPHGDTDHASDDHLASVAHDRAQR